MERRRTSYVSSIPSVWT